MPSSPPSPRNAELIDVDVKLPGATALRGVSMRVPLGALTVITGSNGAGKSTLLDVLAGIRQPSVGRAVVEGLSRAYVPQRAAIGDRLPVTVHDVVTLGAWGGIGRWRRMDAAARAAVDRAVQLMALTPMERTPFAALSGGQQQRALLAQGLARGADLLLLDEPTAALDADSAERILEAIESEIARGATVVCASHDPAVIDMAARVVRLADGRVESDVPEACRQ